MVNGVISFLKDVHTKYKIHFLLLVQNQLKSCRDDQGRRIRASGRTAPPGRDLGPMKWGVGRVIYEAAMREENEACFYKNGTNNGKLIVLPYYHLNMEEVLPEDEDLSVISMIPGKKKEIYCMVGSFIGG